MNSTLLSFPDTARLWVYQADRRLTKEETEFVNENAAKFCLSWSAHGQALQATFQLEYDQFLVLMVDERQAEASGCSIDASVSFIRALENKLGLTLLDRGNVAYLQDNEVKMIGFSQVKPSIQQGKITADTKIFNNSVSTYGDWKNQWLQPAGQSWMKRFF